LYCALYRLDGEQLSAASLKQRLSDEQFTNRKLEEKIQDMRAANSEQDKVIALTADIYLQLVPV